MRVASGTAPSDVEAEIDIDRHSAYPELSGRKVVVLGSGDYAWSIAEAFVQNGSVVMLVGCGEMNPGPSAIVLPPPWLARRLVLRFVDMSESGVMSKPLTECLTQWGRADVLVSCIAGDPRRRAMTEIDEDEWHRTLKIILSSTFFAARQVLPGMIAHGGGRVILVGSLLASNPPWASRADYAAAKGGLLGLARHMAREFGRQGIRTNTVIPGITDLEWSEIEGTELEDTAVEAIPVGYRTVPEDLASLVLFLASEGASYVNGATLLCNGGRSM